MCILIAEDEPLILLGVQLCFEDAGHDVVAVHRGQEAIDLIEARPGHFTCLITDLHMPGGVMGTQVIEHMRPLYPAIPMIMATALPSAVPEAWRSGLCVYLVAKPYDPDELVGTVQRLLAA